MSELPEIRIQYSYLLGGMESKALAEKFGYELKDNDYYYQRTDQYWQAWQKHAKKLLTAMQEVLGISFKLAIIDAYGAPFFIPKSAQLLFNYAQEPDRFIDVLTHELCHVLLNDNNKYSDYDTEFKDKIGHAWQKLYGLDNFNAVIHVPVHALCKYLWLDVLKEPKRWERDKKAAQEFASSQSYEASFKYVEQHDYMQILAELKELYGGMK